VEHGVGHELADHQQRVIQRVLRQQVAEALPDDLARTAGGARRARQAHDNAEIVPWSGAGEGSGRFCGRHGSPFQSRGSRSDNLTPIEEIQVYPAPERSTRSISVRSGRL